MARITVEDCIDKFPSRFELVLVASQRARKLYSGELPTIEKNNDKNTVIALREIAETTLTVEQMKENLIQEYQTITINDEEEENQAIENFNSDLNNENLTTNDSNSNLSNEVEKEISELISSQENEIDENYEISKNFEADNLTEKKEIQEESNTLE